jgi:hypothetical protein
VLERVRGLPVLITSGMLAGIAQKKTAPTNSRLNWTKENKVKLKITERIKRKIREHINPRLAYNRGYGAGRRRGRQDTMNAIPQAMLDIAEAKTQPPEEIQDQDLPLQPPIDSGAGR